MLLQKLLSEIPADWEAKITGAETDCDISSLAYDSREVKTGSLFFAIKGMVTDGHLFLDEAIARGAVAVASEQPAEIDYPVTWIQVASIRKFLAKCASQFYGNPSIKLRLVGITGTNGKTTTCYLANSILNQASPSLLLGTIGTMVGSRKTQSTMTTPESVNIQKALSDGLAQGCRHGAVEVSSHALHQFRVFECHFPVAVFTNLTQDHLDYHQTLEKYFRAKQLLFSKDYNPGLEYVVTNRDDVFGHRLIDLCQAKVVSFGMSESSDVRLVNHESTRDGLELNLDFFGRRMDVCSRLIGKHNLYNIMAAATACSLLGVPDESIRRGIYSLKNVPGRFEKVPVEGALTIIVDFAHTPDALGNALDLAAQVSRNRVICVFGCGGDRDRGKRPLMGKIAVEKADVAIITSDNPRSEDPVSIIEEIENGIPTGAANFESIPERKKAIHRALEIAEQGDLILLAGKGHETYQEINGRKFDFDERQIVKEALCLN